MKTLKGSFAFAAVNAGQRQGNNIYPQLTAVSTEGGFRLSGAASRILGVTPGDYVMFISDSSTIENAIVDATHPAHEELAAWCQEQGLDIATPEANIAIHNAFDTWLVAKGVQEKDTKGNFKTCKERLSKKDKETFVSQHFDETMASAMEAEGEDAEALKAALSEEGVTREQQIELLANCIVPKDVYSFMGSKGANAAGKTGSGVSIQFTDSNVWAQLKKDLGKDERKAINRVYSLDVNNIQTIKVDNGYEEVEVKALMLTDYTDETPARKGDKEEE